MTPTTYGNTTPSYHYSSTLNWRLINSLSPSVSRFALVGHWKLEKVIQNLSWNSQFQGDAELLRYCRAGDGEGLDSLEPVVFGEGEAVVVGAPAAANVAAEARSAIFAQSKTLPILLILLNSF